MSYQDQACEESAQLATRVWQIMHTDAVDSKHCYDAVCHKQNIPWTKWLLKQNSNICIRSVQEPL